MPVYNAASFLKQAIESVLNQTYSNFEFIIINDGSTDDSLEIIQSFNDPRIKLINNSHNLGIIKSRNIGLQAATGKFIANMDSDDISLPTRFEKQIAFFEKNPDTVLLGTRLALIDEKNNEIGIWPEDYSIITEEDLRNTLPIINCLGQPTVMMRADVVKAIGYNEKFLHNEDWGLWLEVLSGNGKIAKLPEVLLLYRQHTFGTTINSNKLGIDKKIIKFKYNYLRSKSKTGFKASDRKVLSSLVKDNLKFFAKSISPGSFSVFSALRRINKIKLIQQWFNAKKMLGNPTINFNVLYFFPSIHTGGAERVHASILEATKEFKSFTFITYGSENNSMLGTFLKYTTVIEISELLKLETTKKWLSKKIQKVVVKNPNVKLFSSNSEFFYTLIPSLPANIKLFDLTHAFVHQHESGPELWSLPFVERLTKRVVISEKTKNDFVNLYSKNGIDTKNAVNIDVVPNYVEAQQKLPVKSTNGLMKIAYVGRGSEEKRVDLIAKLARSIKSKNDAFEFHFVGNVKKSIPETYHSYCIFHNEITNQNKLNELYKTFHVLIIASTREGFPLVIMEAMMNGVVPMATNVGGISEHVIDGVNGFLINTINEDDILIELEQNIVFLNNNKAEWLKISNSAHEYALKHFNKNNFFKYYRSLLS